jgi:hypothetical protein
LHIFNAKADDCPKLTQSNQRKVLNQAGVYAITAIGVDSGKTYYIGLEGESFIGYGDDLGTCFLSGVLHVSG